MIFHWLSMSTVMIMFINRTFLLLLVVVLLRQLHHVPRDTHKVIDLLRDLVHNVVEVIYLELAAAIRALASSTVSKFFQQPSLLHELISDPMEVLPPHLHAVLGRAISFLKTTRLIRDRMLTQAFPA